MGLKIAILTDSYYPSFDGVINVVQNYMRKLGKENDCTLIAPKYPKKWKYVESDEFRVIRCKSLPGVEGYRLAVPQFDRNLFKFLKNGKFDLIHVHSPFGLGKYAIKVGKKLNIPVVATLHTKYYDDIYRVVHMKWLTKIVLKNLMKVYNKADSAWTVSEGAKKVMGGEYGVKRPIDVVYNGTDLVYPENAQKLVDVVNKKHNLLGKKNVFLFVGRLALYKNLELILNSLKVLKDKGVDFTMIFVGAGFDEQKIKETSTKLGLDDNVIFTGRINSRSELAGYYLRADLFLFPSLFDTNGLVSIEAAAHKLPTLLIENTCAAENVEDGKNGFLAQNNVESYSSKLMDILNNFDKLKEVGENAYKTIYRSWDDVTAEVFKKYKKIIADYKKTHKKK